ncbi:uncharacterized protein LOC116214699 isoform X2 [Punica granatum]|uniref:Uncharacterized protein LOC116214699 isoform X2 n=1 Tax=Punica granatum TaxID=22663 RepID=A0A218X718_PUNGR|nr:uncharacterized protein LOC116214699 isoform X2 [Punica granatum]OWM81045.1 hypothetical protein CDL15_Pgr007076 [Punica granatum]
METSMSIAGVARKIAVVGSGISGAVCASTLARNGISVTVFESGRGPGGRMSQRRETMEDGKELLFDHGAPCFTLSNATDVMSLVREWESRGLVAEWKVKFGSFDCLTNNFVDAEQEALKKRYVGVPGMNSICRSLCSEPGVECKFGVGVGKIEWLEKENLWRVMGLDGTNHGQFGGVLASDKNVVSSRFTNVTGRPPPLDLSPMPSLSVKVRDIPVSPCFALMLAFAEPLSSVPVKGFTFRNSKVLSWAHCDSSKPGRSTSSERWVLHSTREYAERIIAETGLTKPSQTTLTRVAEELFRELQSTRLDIPQPFFMKAHRWGSAFPLTSVAGEEKCLWDGTKKLAICGDFCVSPNVEGAIISGLAAASRFTETLSCL